MFLASCSANPLIAIEEFDNKKESIFKYLNLDMSDDVFDRLVNKYNLEASNYLVDLLYEAIIKEI